ncbi:trace amine-associated receptor 7a-like [Sarcophilus harrisii]|uniref:trace amine-associated receptor 7a-like n=1 Tax=Sarcophilus harrisii TaxID=9305 RepID=UPI000273B90B|nr:trace amine-associated receptor 7a-like [Sarcophilus harrisii]
MTSINQQNGDVQFCFHNISGSCMITPWSPGIRISLYGILSFITILTVGGNLLVIFSIMYFKQLHSPSNFLVVSLACADCSLGLIVLPFSTIRSVETCWYFGDRFCKFHSALDICFCLASMFNLCFVSIDRYVAITDPLLYPIRFTVTLSGVFIALSWISAFLYSFSLLYTGANEEGLEEVVHALHCEGNCQILFNKTWVIISSLLYFIPFFIMICLNSKIFAVAKHQARKIEQMGNKMFSEGDKVSKRERKAAVTLGIAVMAFLVFWSPYFITVMIDSFFNSIVPPLASDIMIWFAYSNSAINPLIYAFFYPWFRKAIKVVLSCKILWINCSSMNLFSD